jgi:diguanylate cyclase (GGDEF)-like protein
MTRKISVISMVAVSIFAIFLTFAISVLLLWVNQNVSTDQTIFSFTQRITLSQLLIFIAISVFFSILTIRFISDNMKSNFTKFNKYFEDAAIDGKMIDMTNLHYKEFTNLAQSVNKMIFKENRIKEKLEFKEKYLQTLLDAQKNMVIVTSKKKLERVNQTFLDFVNANSLEDFLSKSSCISEYFVEEERYLSKRYRGDSWVKHLLKYPEKSHKVKISVDNSETIFEVSATKQEFGNRKKIVISFYNINELEEQKRAFEESATTDALTQIANRMKFNTVLEQQIEMSKRYNHSFCLILLDIDNFKVINDTYGHVVGDNILRELATLLKESIRKSDMIARWGGEEFAIILPQSRSNTAVRIAEKLRLKVANNSFEDEVDVTCSFGVCSYKKTYDIRTFIENVDDKLYSAKHSGKNRVCA